MSTRAMRGSRRMLRVLRYSVRCALSSSSPSGRGLQSNPHNGDLGAAVGVEGDQRGVGAGAEYARAASSSFMGSLICVGDPRKGGIH